MASAINNPGGRSRSFLTRVPLNGIGFSGRRRRNVGGGLQSAGCSTLHNDYQSQSVGTLPERLIMTVTNPYFSSKSMGCAICAESAQSKIHASDETHRDERERFSCLSSALVKRFLPGHGADAQASVALPVIGGSMPHSGGIRRFQRHCRVQRATSTWCRRTTRLLGDSL